MLQLQSALNRAWEVRPDPKQGGWQRFLGILVWIYYAGMIVLFGAEFTQAWAKHRGAAIVPERGAERLTS